MENTQLQFYTRTQDIWDAMYQDCVQAQTSIEFEQYIMCDDDSGGRFLRLFVEKAKQGVKIRLIFDRLGSRRLLSSPSVAELIEQGGEIHFYNSIGWHNLAFPRSWFPRTHNKLMIVDRKIAYIGSACMAEHMQPWRDTQARITGTLVGEINEEFACIWRKSQHTYKCSAPCSPSPPGHQVRFVVTRPRLVPSPIYRELRHEIAKARHSIKIITPYFLPPLRLRLALYKAVRRGVSVQIMMGEKTDVPLADRVSRTYFPRLLRHGVHVFLYQPTVLHSKYAVIDDEWATLGSSNMDYLSLHHNREANILIRHGGVIKILNDHFGQDLKYCEPVTMQTWKKVPLHYKIVGYMGRVIRRIL